VIDNEKILLLSTGQVNYSCDINFYEPLMRIFPMVINYDFVEKTISIGKKAVNTKIIEIVKKEKPTYVFLISHLNQIDLETLDAISNLGTKIISWFSDDSWRFEVFSKNIAQHVFCSVTTYTDAFMKYKELGLNAIKSQWASNPDYYKRTYSTPLYDVSFVGGEYGNRPKKLEYLKNKGIQVNIFGKGFNSFVEFDRMVDIFNSSKINLNFSESARKGTKDQIKGRVFEVPMCGGFLLTEYTEGIEEYFEIGREIDCFHNMEEAVDKINYYIEHEDKRKKIAEAGYIRSLKNHTWTDRLTSVFEGVRKMEGSKEDTIISSPVRNKYEAAFHGDNFLLELCDSILSKSEIFIETGAYYGHTVEYVARSFKNLQAYSCEPKIEHFKGALDKVSRYAGRVTLSQETSPDFLYKLVEKDPTIIEKEVMFWLDAHSFGYEWPLLDEIKFITKVFKKAFIFIDDFKIPGRPEFQYDKDENSECAWETIYSYLQNDKNYSLHFPDYLEKTSTHHPLVGWVLIEFGHSEIQIPPSIKNSIKSIVYKSSVVPNRVFHRKNKASSNILLTTSAAPSQTPFSTFEKRPPIGVGFLISVLRETGHSVFFIDNYLKPNDFLETDYLQRNAIDYVGIYANTICYRDTLRMLHKLEWFRRSNRWKGKIIVGGPHTTVLPDTIPDFVDFVVQGEGEQAILDIISGKITERIVKYPRIDNLDELPMPAWDYFVDLPYDWGGTFFTEKPIFVINSSRGCPFNCLFCSVGSIWGKKYTYFSAERVVSDIENLIKTYGAKGIYFREDNFTLNKSRLNKFCNLLIEKNIKIQWACESRVSSIDKENIELMKKSGCCGFYFGVESGSQRVLDFIRKDITIAQTKEAFKLCHEFGINAAASIVVGVPTETEEELNQTLSLIDEIKPTVTWFNVFTGIPNSKLYKYTMENNLYKFIDDRGLVYLPDHDKLTKRFYGGNWDAAIPKQTPKISVVMSVYNGEKYIEEAIQSILRQTYQDFEFIIVNDCSTDKTVEIINSFKDTRIKIIENLENIGLTKSLNKGIKCTKGEYIARMDADDISLPHRFETQVGFLEKNKDYALIGSSFYQVNEEGKTVFWTRVLTEDSEIRRGLKNQNWFGHGSVLIRKSAFIECEGYNEEFECAQDYDLWLRISEKFKIANIEEPLYCWRFATDNITITKKKKQIYYKELAITMAEIRNTLVSVIIPTYNRPEMLAEALASVFSQTHKIYEIIVVNDAGEDVKEVISAFNANNVITYICHSTNKGLASSRNSGLEIAKGKYITYLDDDDIFYPDHLETLITFLEASDYKIAYTDAIRADQVLQKDGKYKIVPSGLYMSRDFSRKSLLKNNISPVHCFMHEKSCLEGGIRFDPTLLSHEDWDLWIRLARKYDFQHIKKATVEYRHRKEGFTQLSNSTNPMFSRSGRMVIDRYRDEEIESVLPTVSAIETKEEKTISIEKKNGIIDIPKNTPTSPIKIIIDTKRAKQGRRKVDMGEKITEFGGPKKMW